MTNQRQIAENDHSKEQQMNQRQVEVDLLAIGFFFSSRRRHTRWTGDWSSDVCSSDLVMAIAINTGGVLAKLFSEAVEATDRGPVEGVRATGANRLHERSEERRVGKECRTRRSP